MSHRISDFIREFARNVARRFCDGSVLRLIILMVGPSVAFAQEQGTQPASDVQLGEVVVTAQKYTQRLQDVPLSVSAVSSQEIEARNAASLEDLQYSIPGLSAFEYGPGVEQIQIRGIASEVGGPTVGQYIDEMGISGTNDISVYAPDVRLIDMDRVEVLRGPQGTLYGQGSIGGTIRYVTASPSLTQMSGSVEGQVGSVTDGGLSYRGTAVLSLPVVDNYVGLRLVGAYERDGGWIDNTTTGASNVNGVDITTARAKLLVQPADTLKVSVLFQHESVDQDNQNFGTDGKTTGTVATLNDSHYNLANLVVTDDLGGLLLTESAGYLDNQFLDQDDLTSLYLPLLTSVLQLPPGFINQIGYPATFQTHTFNDELRVTSQAQSPLHYTVGGWFQKIDTWLDSGTFTAPGTLPFQLLAVHDNNSSSAFAVFGEASYDITSQFNALAGLRYYRDREDAFLDSISLGFPSPNFGNATFHTLNPRFNLSYKFSTESMVYFNAAKGFRSGGFNATAAGEGATHIPPTFDPDSLWSYEVGTKQLLFDRKLELAADVYYNDWRDVQSSFYAPGSAITVTENGGKVTGWGTDLTATAHPVSGLSIIGSYGWNNLAYRTQTADKDVGDPVDYAVRQSYSASVDYRWPLLDSTKALIRMDYQHSGEAQITLRDFSDQIVRLPAQSLVGARVGLDWGRYEAAIVATNLFDNRHVIIPGPYGVISENVEQRPRTVGLNFSAHF